MNQLPKLTYKISDEIFDAKSCLDEENFYNQRQGSPSELTKKMTYLLGDYSKNYPISTLTLGAEGFGATGTRSVELPDIQFTYPTMGRLEKANIVAKTIYTTGDQPGIGHSEFDLYFSKLVRKVLYLLVVNHRLEFKMISCSFVEQRYCSASS